MNDPVFEAYLAQQFEQGTALAAQSDVLSLVPFPSREGPSPDRYIAKFFCKGLVRGADGSIGEASEFHVGIWFPADYLRRIAPPGPLTWLYPPNIWHPNIRPPFVCAGHMMPGSELVVLIYQVYEIITYFNWAPHDALNAEASQWARNHQYRFPLETRPLKRRHLNLQVTDSTPER